MSEQVDQQPNEDELKARCWDSLKKRISSQSIDGVLARRMIREMGDIMLTMNAERAKNEPRA